MRIAIIKINDIFSLYNPQNKVIFNQANCIINVYSTLLTGLLRNPKQRRTQPVVIYYHITLINHRFVPSSDMDHNLWFLL
jgi:hypothetical protein